ncbi:hypothetical protein [Pedobacter xixiisoli]|uniref:Lipocalin-like domain-containing protein n=1 Tax=Pedobacter xixiisoli TaxID=1476464 RepID=A0A285ZX52_9SPHI|nr:hypothetical protein [Pedobacter xixiisoli]SOD14229.1 hypothetical protein SAMN06297358_1469 [Pedobacter xixiisoli]
MKNLSNLFAKTLLIFSALFVLASCKKDKAVEKDDDKIDFTKYYITGEYETYGTRNGYVYTFGTLMKVTSSSVGSSNSGSYTYTDGNLRITHENNQSYTLKIANGVITSSDAPALITYHLQKIPDADAFAGKNFKGTVATNGLANGKSCLIKFTTAGKFTVSIDGFGQTGNGADYTLQNNGVATANTGNEGRLHLMTLADGKLYYSQSTQNTHYYGVLTLQ